MDLLTSTARIEIPFISVDIGGYTFGIYQRKDTNKKDDAGFYKDTRTHFPNYVKSLQVQKINGQVNRYTLNLVYPIRPGDDPNFFEKVFSSVSVTKDFEDIEGIKSTLTSRCIYFSYGDLAIPNYIYKKEQAIVTNIQEAIDVKNNSISYTVSAISSAILALSGTYTFEAREEKPSVVIRDLLYNKEYSYLGLIQIFPGMFDEISVDSLGLIPDTDEKVKIETKSNVTIYEYLSYLVNCMRPNKDKISSSGCYILTIRDDSNIMNEFSNIDLGGTYFQITLVDKANSHPDAFDVYIGAPTANLVLEFTIDKNENYSIYYDFQNSLKQSDYVERLDEKGNLVTEYSPSYNSATEEYKTTPDELTWWKKVTQYPISASLRIKGLLRPSMLMQYINIHTLFYGREHISSGSYIVTKQIDTISESGYQTQLALTRVSGIDPLSM